MYLLLQPSYLQLFLCTFFFDLHNYNCFYVPSSSTFIITIVSMYLLLRPSYLQIVSVHQMYNIISMYLLLRPSYLQLFLCTFFFDLNIYNYFYVPSSSTLISTIVSMYLLLQPSYLQLFLCTFFFNLHIYNCFYVPSSSTFIITIVSMYLLLRPSYLQIVSVQQMYNIISMYLLLQPSYLKLFLCTFFFDLHNYNCFYVPSSSTFIFTNCFSSANV